MAVEKKTSLKKTKLRNRQIFIALAVILGFLWSWLFLIDVGKLAEQQPVGIITISAVYVFIVSISAWIFSISIKYLKNSYKKHPDFKWIIKAVFVWALTEALVAWIITILWFGKNGSIDNILPFSSLTPYIIVTPLKYMSRFVGFYGISSVVIVGIVIFFMKKVRKFAYIYWLIVIAICSTSWLVYKVTKGSTFDATIVSEHLGDSSKIAVGGSKLIVVPEYGLDDSEPNNFTHRFQESSNDYYFVGSKQKATPKGHNNVLIFGSRTDGFIKEQPKNRLIVGGEYLSFWVEGLLQIFSPSTVTDFQVRREVIKGNNAIELFNIEDDVVVGSAVCSSIISPEDYRHFTNKGATILTNSASLEIFRGSRLFDVQHRGFAKFMAVANARPFLQSSNNWQAFAIDKDGNQVAEIDPSNTAQITIQSNTTKTIYTFAGEWLVYVGAIIVGYDLFKNRKNPFKLFK